MGLPGGGTGKAQKSFVFTPASWGRGLRFWLEGKILRPMDEHRGWSLNEDSVQSLYMIGTYRC